MPPRVCRASVCRRLPTVLLGCTLLATTVARAQKSPAPPAVTTESLPTLLQRGAGAFAAGDFSQAAAAFTQVEREFGRETPWTSGELPRRLLPLRGFAQLRAGQPADAAESLALFLERFPDETGQRAFALYAHALACHEAGHIDAALEGFARFEAEHPESAQAALARLQRAEILFGAGRPDEAFSLLQETATSDRTAASLRVHARLRLLERAVELRRDALAIDLLLAGDWTVATMPEIAVLAFAAMEIGDRLLAAGRAEEAIAAFRLVPPKRRLIAAQSARLEELQRLVAERGPAAATGPGAFWADFYRARVARISAQLAALEGAEDYTAPLRLRAGQAMLLAHRAHEAWLCFESIATAEEAPVELRREAHYRWILAAVALARWDDALVIAREFVASHPAADLAPEAFFLIARAHLERQQLDAAETVLTDIVDRFPEHPAARRSRFTRGWVRAMRGDHAAARADFEACIAADPGGPLAAQAGLWRGLTHHFAREYAPALEAFDALARDHARDPILPEVLYRRAVTLHAMRELPRARSELESFVSTFPMHARHAEALVLLGDTLMGAAELDEARRVFAEVPAEQVDAHAYATFQTGKILRAQGDTAGVAAHFSAYVRRAAQSPLPRVGEALYWIGWAEEQRGDPAAALPAYAAALERNRDDPAATEVGSILAALQKLSRRVARSGVAAPATDAPLSRIAAGDFEGWLRAERDLARSQSLATWESRLTLALADIHLARREPAQAELLILELAGAMPLEALDATGLARVGSTLQAIGSADAAAYFRRVLEVHPRSAERAVAFHGLAVEAARAQSSAEALAWVERFERETPAHNLAAEVALLAGSVLEAAGRHNEAARRYDALLAMRSARGRPHARALAGLARCARADGDPARAIACYQRLYTLHRAQCDLAAEAYLESAPLFEQLGDVAAAAATYREMLALPQIGDAAQRDRARDALETLEGAGRPEPAPRT